MKNSISIWSNISNNSAFQANENIRENRTAPLALHSQLSEINESRAHIPATNATQTRTREKAETITENLNAWQGASQVEKHRPEAVELINDSIQRKPNSLCFSHLRLSSLPNSITALTHLKELTLDHNKLATLPENLENLRNLERINLSNNKLAEFPVALCVLTSLKSIKSSNNKIAEFPQRINRLTALRTLHLDGNRIKELPPEAYQIARGAIVFIHNNYIPQIHQQTISCNINNRDYDGPAIFHTDSLEQIPRVYDHDLFSKVSDLKKIEELLGSADRMSDGLREAPVNFRLGGRNMNKKECLLMALEISLVSHRELTPAISYSLLNELPSDTSYFLIKSVSFNRDRIESWSRNEALPIRLEAAREVIDVESSLLENGPEFAYNQDQNVHDKRVHGNFLKQLFLIESRVKNPVSAQEAMREIAFMIGESSFYPMAEKAYAKNGLTLVMTRNDIARGFTKSPAETLSLVWTHIGSTDPEMKKNLHGALMNRLVEIGSGHICGLGITERIIDIPTAVDWSITNSISFDHLHTEIAKMASDVNEEFESKFGDHADHVRNLKTCISDASMQGDTEQRINEIKRDMFLAKARVELVVLRNLDESLVAREIGKIFDAAVMRERI